MSSIQYIASDRPLPAGVFANAPLYVFDSLMDFARSDVYPAYLKNHLAAEAVRQRNWLKNFNRPAPQSTPPEEFLEAHRDFEGRVMVWSDDHLPKGFSIKPFREWNFSGDSWVRRADLETKLTKPHIYTVHGNYLDYLCWALRPGEAVEYLRCWNGEERAPLAAPDRQVDLEDYVQSGELPRENADGNHRILYRAPREPQPYDCTLEWGSFRHLWRVDLDDGRITSILSEYQREENRLREIK